jgi:hypothetical protein
MRMMEGAFENRPLTIRRAVPGDVSHLELLSDFSLKRNPNTKGKLFSNDYIALIAQSDWIDECGQRNVVAGVAISKIIPTITSNLMRLFNDKTFNVQSIENTKTLWIQEIAIHQFAMRYFVSCCLIQEFQILAKENKYEGIEVKAPWSDQFLNSVFLECNFSAFDPVLCGLPCHNRFFVWPVRKDIFSK